VSEAVSAASNATFPIGSIVVQRVAKSLLILINSGDMCRSVPFILIRTADQARGKSLATSSFCLIPFDFPLAAVSSDTKTLKVVPVPGLPHSTDKGELLFVAPTAWRGIKKV
jgi:hypothetical protein